MLTCRYENKIKVNIIILDTTNKPILLFLGFSIFLDIDIRSSLTDCRLLND